METVHNLHIIDVVKELERINDSLEFDMLLKVSERRALHKRFKLLKNR